LLFTVPVITVTGVGTGVGAAARAVFDGVVPAAFPAALGSEPAAGTAQASIRMTASAKATTTTDRWLFIASSFSLNQSAFDLFDQDVSVGCLRSGRRRLAH
jgi:hypothetical protein